MVTSYLTQSIIPPVVKKPENLLENLRILIDFKFYEMVLKTH